MKEKKGKGYRRERDMILGKKKQKGEEGDCFSL